MTKNIVGFFKHIPSTYTYLIAKANGKSTSFVGRLAPDKTNIRLYSEGAGRKPPREEQIDTVKMPGFVHPESKHEEGYFTQKAKQQLEELKKKLDKPTVENPEKKE